MDYVALRSFCAERVFDDIGERCIGEGAIDHKNRPRRGRLPKYSAEGEGVEYRGSNESLLVSSCHNFCVTR